MDLTSRPFVRELEFIDNLANSAPPPSAVAAETAPSRSREYWVLFNQAESDYREGKYGQALNALSRLKDIGIPHKTALSLFLRCYRKIRDVSMKRRDWPKAFEASTLLLSEILLDTTATDDRKHNNIVDALSRMDSGSVAERVAVRESHRNPVAPTELVRVMSDRDWAVSSTELKTVADKYETRWKNRVITDLGTLEIAAWGLGRFGDPDSRGVARYHPANGEATIVYPLDHVAYRIGTHPKAKAFATMSPDLEMSIYDLTGHRLGRYDLPQFSDQESEEDKYKVRCVLTSPAGNLHMYTSVHQATLFDQQQGKKWVVQTPAAPGYQKRVERSSDPESDAASSQVNDAVHLLGVSSRAQPDEVKRAYRALAMECHPDKNPGDELALERMKLVNNAYEVLSGESPAAAWDTDKEVEVYYRILSRSSIDIEGFGRVNIETRFSGIGQDWIYAAAFNEIGTKVFLGCYSGRIFILDLSSMVIGTLDARETVVSIVPSGSNLLVETSSRVLSFVDGEYRGAVTIGTPHAVTYFPGGFIITDGKTLRVFDSRTTHLGDLITNDTIRGFWRVGNDLAIEMNKACARISGVFRDLPSYEG